MASIPDFLFSMVRQSSTLMLYLLQMNCTTQGSMSPERVPIGTPARGLRPMEVSMHLPSLIADREEPLPRWQFTILKFFLPTSSAVRLATYLWEVPWKP